VTVIPLEVFLAVVGIVVGGAVARRLRLVPRARWTARRLWCESVGHDWQPATVDDAPDGFRAGFECARCGAASTTLRQWREAGDEAGDES
jgi:hypothetical protein